MKRIFGLAVLALSLAALLESSAAAKAPPGIGTPCRRVGRFEGYWLSGPTRGPLYDYSSYFATLYPYLPNAAEYQWQATVPGQFGSAIAILPTSPPVPVRGTVPPGAAPSTPPPPVAPATPAPAKSGPTAGVQTLTPPSTPAPTTPTQTTTQSIPTQTIPARALPFRSRR